ncbi:MAG: hypothetical protein KIS96_12855 [Bauldia sp.]|nr:hypothetical protein [Bauldia sp.]
MKRLLLATTAIVALAAAPALATDSDDAMNPGAAAFGVDVDAVGMGEFTLETVDPADPFGDIEVNVSATADANAIAGFLATLTAEQLTELTQRCLVIEANADNYAEADVNFCALALALLRASGDAPAAGEDDAAAPPDDAEGDDDAM